MGTLGRCKRRRPCQCISIAWTYAFVGNAMLLYATQVHHGHAYRPPPDKDSLKWGSIMVMTCDSNDGGSVFAGAMCDL